MEPISHQRLLEVLNYDPETGEFTWATSRPKAREGDPAGCVKADGYRYIRVDYRAYLGHRLAWFYVTGAWPETGLDHKNRIRSDNRIANLRLATVSQNGANSPTKNKTGLKGVQPYGKKPRYAARLFTGGKNHYLGTFDTPEEAHEAYKKAAEKFFGNFHSN